MTTHTGVRKPSKRKPTAQKNKNNKVSGLTWEWFGRGEFGVTAWCVHTTDLDEASHEHDEGDTHQQDCPPVGLEKRTEHKSTRNTHLILIFSASRRDRSTDTYHDPLGDVLIQLWVEDGLLQPGQRPVGIHQAALHENVAVALEVVARRARWQRGRFLIEETSQTL